MDNNEILVSDNESPEDSFVSNYYPIASKISERTGRPAEAVLGQFALETGWGKSVIPGTRNLGNIKGKGVAATDNMTGSRDEYRAYDSDDAFAEDYIKLVGNKRYKANGPLDTQGHFTNLKAGGYAEDPDYVNKGVQVSDKVRKIMERKGLGKGEILVSEPRQNYSEEILVSDSQTPHNPIQIMKDDWATLGRGTEDFIEYGANKAASAQEAIEDWFLDPNIMAKFYGLLRGTADIGVQTVAMPGAAIKNIVQESGREMFSEDPLEGNAATRAWKGTQRDLADITAASYYDKDDFDKNTGAVKGRGLVEGVFSPITDLEKKVEKEYGETASSLGMLGLSVGSLAGLKGMVKKPEVKVNAPDARIGKKEPLYNGLTDPKLGEAIREAKAAADIGPAPEATSALLSKTKGRRIEEAKAEAAVGPKPRDEMAPMERPTEQVPALLQAKPTERFPVVPEAGSETARPVAAILQAFKEQPEMPKNIFDVKAYEEALLKDPTNIENTVSYMAKEIVDKLGLDGIAEMFKVEEAKNAAMLEGGQAPARKSLLELQVEAKLKEALETQEPPKVRSKAAQEVSTTLNADNAATSSSQLTRGMTTLVQRHPDGRIGDLLNYIRLSDPSKINRLIAKVVMDAIGDVRYTLTDIKAPGQFNLEHNIIRLKKGQMVDPRTVLHEAIHAMFAGLQITNPRHPAIQTINFIADLVKGEFEANGLTYGTMNRLEFLAVALSDKVAQSILINTKLSASDRAKINAWLEPKEKSFIGKINNAWEGFMAGIASMFDRPDILDSTAMGALLRAGDSVAKELALDPKKQAMLSHRAAYLAHNDPGAFLWNTKENPKLAAEYRKKINDLNAPSTGGERVIGPETYERLKDIYGHMIEAKDSRGNPVDLPSSVMGWATMSWGEKTKFLMNPDNVAHALTNFIDTGVVKMQALESKILHSVEPHLARYQSYYKYGLPHKRSLWKKDIKTRLEMERDPTTWGGDKNKLMPTEQDMIAAGMSPESAKVWLEIDKAIDKLWTVLEETTKLAGHKMPPRVPGYIPHMFRGSYRVEVLLKRVSSGGKEIVLHEREHAFDSMNQADPLYRQSMDQIHGKTYTDSAGNAWTAEVVYHKPDLTKARAAEELNALWSRSEKMEIPPLKKALDAIWEGTIKGQITHAMDRNNITKKGHLLERVFEDGAQGLNSRGMKEAFHAFDNYAKAVAGYHTRVRLAKEFLFPLKNDGWLVDRPNVADYVRRRTDAFFGATKDIFRGVLQPFESRLGAMGWNPKIVRAVSGAASGAMSTYYLLGNYAYYIVNTLQVVMIPFILYNEKFKLEQAFGKPVSINKSMVDYATSQIGRLNGTGEHKMLHSYAREHGYADPVFVEALVGQQGLLGSALNSPNRLIDRFTRQTAYNIGYQLAKQVMTPEKAKEYAGHISREVNVPYNPEGGAPMLFGEAGALRPIFQFLTFQQHMLGALNQTLKLSMREMKSKDPQRTARSLNNVAALAVATYGMYGLSGLPFSQIYDQLGFYLSKAGTANIPSLKEFARSLDEKTPVIGKYAPSTFGLGAMMVSYVASGMNEPFDLTGAGSGVSFNPFSSVGPKFLEHMAAIAVLSLKTGAGIIDPMKKPTEQQMWDYLRTAPPMIRKTGEMAIKGQLKPMYNGKLFGEVRELLAGNLVDSVLSKDPLLKERDRTPEEFRTQFMGPTPIPEAYDKITENTVARTDSYLEQKIEKYLRLVKEGDESNADEALEELIDIAEVAGRNPKELLDAIMRYRVSTHLNAKERRARLLTSRKGLTDWQTREQLNEKTPEMWRR